PLTSSFPFLASCFQAPAPPASSPLSLHAALPIFIVCDLVGAGFWGTVIPLWLFMTACGFTFPCVQVLALDRHGKAAGTAASVLGASNNGVAAIISPAVGLISAGSGITATTMATVMVGCAVIAVLALWLIVRPRTVEMLAP